MLKPKLLLSVLFLFIPVTGFAHGVNASDQATLNNGNLWSYIYVGAKHMLTGYDHLLFLAGVIFFLNNFKDILKFITVFTIAHCITLTGATYLGINANEHLVDAIIALSVFYKGFENLGGFKKLNIEAPNLLFMIFLFGLIHGFGLSTKLQSFTIDSDNFFLKIFSFNFGVEIGQVLALIPIVILITKLRKQKSYPALYNATNTYLIITGLFLCCYQLYNYIV